MKKNILTKGIIIPFVIGVVLAIAVFCSFIGMDTLIPVKAGTAIAYFDENKEITADESIVNCADLKNNQKIGTLSFGKASLDIRYKSTYSNLIDSVSLTNGSVFGKAGACYLEAINSNVDKIKNSSIKVDSVFGKYTYKYADSYKTKNKNDVFLKNIDSSRCIVIYYQIQTGYGFSSSYEALVFEEVTK